MQQLVVWHKNRDRKRQSVRSLSTLLGAVGISKKCGRLPQEQELYSDQYYKSDILPLVEARRDEIEADLGRKLDAKQRLNNVKACTKQAWDDAPTAVKRDIRKTLKKMKEDRKAGRAGRGLDIDVADRTPQQYQEYVPHSPFVRFYISSSCLLVQCRRPHPASHPGGLGPPLQVRWLDDKRHRRRPCPGGQWRD